VLALRETPLTLIDLENARAVARAGGVIMPISPPFFMTEGKDPREVTMIELIDAYVDRVLKIFGVPPARTWEHIR
jgi:4-hydroxy-3-polyprenylbenzoate decarboxylase